METETVITRKGTSTIPEEIRRQAGLEPGTILSWDIRDNGVIEVRKKAGVLNAAQRHVRARAGTWDGKISGRELLHRTRP